MRDYEPVFRGDSRSPPTRYFHRKWETSYTKKVVDALERSHPYNFKIHDAVQLLIQYHRDLHVPYEQRDAAERAHRALTIKLNEKDERIDKLKGDIRQLQAHLAEANNIARGTHKGNSHFGDQRTQHGVAAELHNLPKGPMVGFYGKPDIYGETLKWNVFAGESERAASYLAENERANTIAETIRAHFAGKQEYMACAHYPYAIENKANGRVHCEYCCEKEPLKWYDNGKHREPGK